MSFLTTVSQLTSKPKHYLTELKRLPFKVHPQLKLSTVNWLSKGRRMVHKYLSYQNIFSLPKTCFLVQKFRTTKKQVKGSKIGQCEVLTILRGD